MREDQDSELSQVLIATDMVAVDVRIDQEADIAGRHTPDGSDQLLGQRRKQGINEQDAFSTDEHPDVATATRSLDHVDVARDRLD